MLGLFGEYDVVVAGAGVTGVIAAVAAARQHARTLLIEASGSIGGMLTGGRLTKPTGLVEGGICRELLERAASYGGADPRPRRAGWGFEYSGLVDPETMQRVILEVLEQSGVEVLLHAQVVDVVCDDGLRGLELYAKSGRKLVLARATVDATGDGDVASRAGAPFQVGRSSDGQTQPLTAYFRVSNVDTPRLAAYVRAHPEDFTNVVLPETAPDQAEHYAFQFSVTGFMSLIQQAKQDGNLWVPRSEIDLKAGLLPGEINVNATRVQGNALDERALSRAEIEVRQQAYNIFDFLKQYVPGFEAAGLLDIARLGVRETRRITGDYVLTADDIRAERRFPDSIGLAKVPIDIHEPGGRGVVIEPVREGYTIPYRCLLPRGITGLLVAGRCVSADEIAHGSTRNTPACAITGQAAGAAAALAASSRTSPRQLDVSVLQRCLADSGVPLGLEQGAKSSQPVAAAG